MGGLLHLPQGGAQIVVVSEIPEVPIPGEDASIEDMLATLGTYTQVVAPDGTYKTPAEIWDGYLDWEKTPGNGDMCIINSTKHNGLNFGPSSTQNPYTVSFMFINRVMNFASKRIIGYAKMSEGSWGTTVCTLYFLPYDTKKPLTQEIAQVKNVIDGGTDDSIITMSFRHNGYGEANDDVGLMLGELPFAGKYKVAIHMDYSPNNVCPTIYSLNFRTY